jgi:hypothetical protein
MVWIRFFSNIVHWGSTVFATREIGWRNEFVANRIHVGSKDFSFGEMVRFGAGMDSLLTCFI